MTVASSQSAAPTRDGDLRIGDVFSRAFSITIWAYRQFLLPFGVIMLPTAALDWMQSTEGQIDHKRAIAIFLFFPFFSDVLIGSFTSALIPYGTFQSLRGRPVGAVASFQVGVKKILSIFVIVMLQTILVIPLYIAGSGSYLINMTIETSIILLVLNTPWLIAATIWCAAISACVVEQLGQIDSLKRSAQLSKNQRLKIFGMILMSQFGGAILVAILSMIPRIIWGRATEVIGLYLSQTFFSIFASIVGVAIYHSLRIAKEGIDTEAIAAVFE